ncbi:MAG: hypothetical protein JO113_00285, partial [Candidatus Eremiobacteraeota bacterium]|nr:hypothetical protein [Candidatus Eremiobacteraeota bacterium]
YFRSLAGQPQTEFAWEGPIVPFERRARTPTIVPYVTQFENAAEITATLGQLLHTTGGVMPHQ